MTAVVSLDDRRHQRSQALSDRQRHMVLSLAQAALQAGQPARAVLLLHPLTRANSQDVQAHNQLCQAYQLLGRHDAAIAISERLYAHGGTGPADRRLGTLHVLALLRSGATHAARLCFGRLIAADQTSP